MNVASGPDLAAAVTNAGGVGVIGGLGYTPKFLREQIGYLKEGLVDKKAPFGVDLLLPKVGGDARKTNFDYTGGHLMELAEVIVEEGAKLFVSAVGVPPAPLVERLHKGGVVVANVIGHPKHAPKAAAAGVDMIIVQGGEGGGHTGDVPFSVLVPRVVDLVHANGWKSPLTGKPVLVVAAGGVWNGRSLAASLAYGAAGVWVGTRFVASVESGAPKRHKEAVLAANHESDVRTLVFTGRPLRLKSTPYIAEWEAKPAEIKRLTDQGVIPHKWDMEHDDDQGTKEEASRDRFLMGKCAATITDILPAKQIVDNFIDEAVTALKQTSAELVGPAKL